MTAGKLLAYKAMPPLGQNGLGVESIEAWPAVGGGLLVGIAEPALAGAAPQRRSVKTVFLNIDCSGAVTLILPYVALEEEARWCARALVTAELPHSGCRIDAPIPPVSGRGVIDIDPAAERGIQACAATARMLLLEAAAEAWDVPVERCRVEAGAIHGVDRDRTVTFGEIAPDAALCMLTVLQSGADARRHALAD